jgi:hypothetical protein
LGAPPTNAGTGVDTQVGTPAEADTDEPAARAKRFLLGDAVALGVIALLGTVLVWSRFSLLGGSFWQDEAYSAVRYIDPGPSEIFFGRYIPNNHVLFSLVTWMTTEVGGRSEPVYRFWSVVPATAAVALTAWWAWRRISRFASAIVVLLAMASPLHLDLAPQARGYGLALLAGAGLLVSAVRAAEETRTSDVVLFAAFGLLGIWTLPVFVLLFLAQGAVLVASSKVRRRAVVAIAGVGAASFLWYIPLLGDVLANSDQRFGERLPWHGWLTGPFDDLADPMLENLAPNRAEWLRETPLVATIAVVLVILAVVRCWRRRELLLLANLLVPVVGVYVALTIARFFVVPRFASYLLLHVIVLLALGATELWALATRVPVLRMVTLLALVLVVGFAVRNVSVATSAKARVPHENFRAVGEVVQGSERQEVFTNTARVEGLYFYLGRERLAQAPLPFGLAAIFCDETRSFIYVDENYPNAPDPDTTCLQRRGATPIHFRQRLGGSIDVWLVPARTD